MPDIPGRGAERRHTGRGKDRLKIYLFANERCSQAVRDSLSTTRQVPDLAEGEAQSGTLECGLRERKEREGEAKEAGFFVLPLSFFCCFLGALAILGTGRAESGGQAATTSRKNSGQEPESEYIAMKRMKLIRVLAIHPSGRRAAVHPLTQSRQADGSVWLPTSTGRPLRRSCLSYVRFVYRMRPIQIMIE